MFDYSGTYTGPWVFDKAEQIRTVRAARGARYYVQFGGRNDVWSLPTTKAALLETLSIATPGEFAILVDEEGDITLTRG